MIEVKSRYKLGRNHQILMQIRVTVSSSSSKIQGYAMNLYFQWLKDEVLKETDARMLS